MIYWTTSQWLPSCSDLNVSPVHPINYRMVDAGDVGGGGGLMMSFPASSLTWVSDELFATLIISESSLKNMALKEVKDLSSSFSMPIYSCGAPLFYSHTQHSSYLELLLFFFSSTPKTQILKVYGNGRPNIATPPTLTHTYCWKHTTLLRNDGTRFFLHHQKSQMKS